MPDEWLQGTTTGEISMTLEHKHSENRSAMKSLSTICLFLAFILSLSLDGAMGADDNKHGPIKVYNPKMLPAEIPSERIPVGGKMGYKPNVVKLSNGELLMANFHTHYETQSDGSMCDHTVLHRSSDDGKTWESKHYDRLPGKEPYLNVFGDVLIMTAHIYPPDIHAIEGRTTAWLHRSEDRGHTWTSQVLDIDRIPEKVSMTYSSRNIIELDDGSYALGIGCGNGRDYLFLSKDKGISWAPKKIRVSGFDNRSYRYSVLQEGIFFRTTTGRLLLLARCELPKMKNLDKNLPGLPDFDFTKTSDIDSYDMEIIFESKDDGMSWSPMSAIPLVGCMYPSVCDLGGGKHLFTFTKRMSSHQLERGVYACFLNEQKDGLIKANIESDLMVISQRTLPYLQSGGGFGNTLLLDDGSLITPYSYYHAVPEIDALMKSGGFRNQKTFELYRNRALPYYRRWVTPLTWESFSKQDLVMQTHVFLGCCQVLNLCGPATEVAKWKLNLSTK